MVVPFTNRLSEAVPKTKSKNTDIERPPPKVAEREALRQYNSAFPNVAQWQGYWATCDNLQGKTGFLAIASLTSFRLLSSRCSIEISLTRSSHRRWMVATAAHSLLHGLPCTLRASTGVALQTAMGLEMSVSAGTWTVAYGKPEVDIDYPNQILAGLVTA
jgi:hypothetical protein